MARIKAAIYGTTAGLAMTVAGPLVAELSSAEVEGRQRISMATRQSALVEQMTKAACMAAHGVHLKEELVELATARETYRDVKNALLHGNAETGMEAERRPSVINALHHAEVEWKPFAEAADRLLAAEGHDEEDLKIMDEHGDALLMATDAAAAMIQNEYGKHHVPLNVAIGISITARQRVLVERMAKEACMIAHGIHVEQHMADLSTTLEMFTLAHEALVNGMEAVGIHPPQGAPLKAKLAEAGALWAELGPDYQHIVRDRVVNADDLELIFKDTEPLVHALDEAVYHYEQEDPATKIN